MATLEDKILGEKLEYYCSSSEDEGENSGNSDKEEASCPKSVPSTTIEINEWDGSSSNTGPKGVIRDWQRFKQLESEKRAQQEKERIELMKKLTLTCQSSLDDEKEKNNENDNDIAELLEDEFVLEFERQRMREMLAKANKLKFGNVIHLLNGDEFLNAIDNEDKTVTVIVHIYEKDRSGCEAMNGCLNILAKDYLSVKFCKIEGSAAGLSKHFKREGVPALLVYKNGQVIGNFVRLIDTLGIDFYAPDVEDFLIEHGFLIDKNNIPKIMSNTQNCDDSD